MINISKLEIGDIIGTTSGSPVATLIKIKTWGWRRAFSQQHSSHIATVVNRGHGLLYLAEMLPGGIELTNIHEYDNKAPRQHFCWVGRHPAFGSEEVKLKYNNLILALHSRKVRYGYDDLINYISEGIGIHLKDREDRIICSELPRVGFKGCSIPYPSNWEGKCSPMDWQCWVDMKNITGDILC